MAFTFKHVGKSLKDAQPAPSSVTPEDQNIAIGIKTPLSLGTKEILSVNYDLIDQISDNIRNLVQTNWGERLAVYEYGANLGPLLSELVSQEDFDSQAMQRISAAVGNWMPYVQLNTFTSTVQYSQNGTGMSARVINLNYDVPTLNVQNKSLEIALYAM